MDDIWRHVILVAFTWAILAIIVAMMPVIVRKWIKRRRK
jgi:hypothetical protein